MGLDTTHDCFHGAYSAFNRFRQAICKAMGDGSYPPHDSALRYNNMPLDDDLWYWGDGFGEDTHPGLQILLNHSDCDGKLTPEQCVLVANDLEKLLPTLDKMGQGEGHIQGHGGYGRVARNFIAGCREAAAAGESVEFH